MNLYDEQPIGSSSQRNSDQTIFLPKQVLAVLNYLNCGYMSNLLM